ncbi:hypothetical protein BLNAU_7291 [Blattamonas nauphoetae]|uniref:Uncharacterized protein n=1 Tax=Blattamonas nauphoetae TaxID=2049346 RepID=A0ABQ9Y292_9EUKA|nr:hypothetical protein BLNAU_7291 [Blattamonas nauphoetae]
MPFPNTHAVLMSSKCAPIVTSLLLSFRLRIALVKAEYPFNNALQDRAVQFLKSLKPKWSFDHDYADNLITNLVPSSAGSPSGFVESILTLLSSPCSTVITAALSFLFNITTSSSFGIRCRVVVSDLISNVLATVQTHTLPIQANEKMFRRLVLIIDSSIYLASPGSLRELGITTVVDQLNHREMIFQKAVIPSSQFVTFLISNRYVLNGDLFNLFMHLLCQLLLIGPFHRPTLEFVLASPIVMAITSCLSFIENHHHLETSLLSIKQSLREWKTEGPEVAQSGKRMMQALFSEGFEHTLEQMLKIDEGDGNGEWVVGECLKISKLLGSNVDWW